MLCICNLEQSSNTNEFVFSSLLCGIIGQGIQDVVPYFIDDRDIFLCLKERKNNERSKEIYHWGIYF